MLLRGHVPEPDGLVARAGGQRLAVGRVGDSMNDRERVTDERRQDPPGGGVANPDGMIIGANGTVLPSGA